MYGGVSTLHANDHRTRFAELADQSGRLDGQIAQVPGKLPGGQR
jgi:uncharacterized protein YdcH (DUF465 family)